MKWLFILLLSVAAGCHYSRPNDSLVAIQVQDRNGLTETISNPDRLSTFETMNFLSAQPYKKVLRIYRSEGKNRSKITTYHPNGMLSQYLEAEEMRAHGAYREWFPNGQLRIEARVIGGTADLSPGPQQDWLFDGLNQVWDDQGRPVATISYAKGMLEGPSIYLYPSGQIESELPYAKNVLEGEAVEFTPTGELKSRTLYKKGVKEGASFVYFDQGQPARVEEYREGLLLTGTYYNPQGEAVSEVKNGGGFQACYENNELTLIEFRMGKPDGMVKKFTAGGEIQKAFSLKNGRKQGEEIEFYLSHEREPSPDNKPLPKLSIHWHENMIHGTVKTWYSNGSRQSEREYCRNKKQGPSLAWYRSGALMLIEEYEADQLVKGQYYKINNKEPISSIVNGNGLAYLYDETGAFLRKVSYLKGKPLDPED